MKEKIALFAEAQGIAMSSVNLPNRGEEFKNKFHSLVTLANAKGSITFPYSYGWTKPKKVRKPWGYETIDAVRPRLELKDVLYCLVMESFYCSNTFEEWCDSIGESTDSRKALDTYLQCQTHRNALLKMVGHDGLDELVELYSDY
jgi:hypothetical protein